MCFNSVLNRKESLLFLWECESDVVPADAVFLKLLTLWIVKNRIMILLSLKFAHNGYKRWETVCYPDKTAVTLDRIMKDRPARKCDLAMDQVIHTTHDPYTQIYTHYQMESRFMGVLGSFWTWTLDLIIHKAAFKCIRVAACRITFSPAICTVPPSLGA